MSSQTLKKNLVKNNPNLTIQKIIIKIPILGIILGKLETKTINPKYKIKKKINKENNISLYYYNRNNKRCNKD